MTRLALINVGSRIGTSIAEVARQLGRAFGKAPRLVVTSQYRLGDIRHNGADIARLQAQLDYRPHVTFAEGLQRFASWGQTQPLPEAARKSPTRSSAPGA